MPIYEYECTKCGHQTEAWQKFSDPPLEKCEVCGGKMRKLISHSTFHLKGSGWYVTDYGSRSTSTTSKSKEDKKQVSASEKKKDKTGGKDS
ncbi:MAG: zinc ribbon domain-containing protein [Deltaproteobacteria bacterium]|nr:MAG: zinc ribbon domain-containing protein [Deltaproteobacteria bacterium]RLB81570.1 MAG: zinc ribbon domain-containing protein [Deltaproteobacteria bacterium]